MEWIEIRARTRFCALPNLASPPPDDQLTGMLPHS